MDHSRVYPKGCDLKVQFCLKATTEQCSLERFHIRPVYSNLDNQATSLLNEVTWHVTQIAQLVTKSISQPLHHAVSTTTSCSRPLFQSSQSDMSICWPPCQINHPLKLSALDMSTNLTKDVFKYWRWMQSFIKANKGNHSVWQLWCCSDLRLSSNCSPWQQISREFF